MELSKSDATDLVYGEDVEGFCVIATELVGVGRWSQHKRLIFKKNDTARVWAVDYQVGATENQEQGPFKYSSDPIKCYEVVSVPCTKYVRKVV